MMLSFVWKPEHVVLLSLFSISTNSSKAKLLLTSCTFTNPLASNCSVLSFFENSLSHRNKMNGANCIFCVICLEYIVSLNFEDFTIPSPSAMSTAVLCSIINLNSNIKYTFSSSLTFTGF